MDLETERLILRPWNEDDAEACFELAKDPRVGPICGWAPHTSVEESRHIIRVALAVPETYAIVLKETGKLVGDISLMKEGRSDLAKGDNEFELGYWLGVPYWGRGIMTEAARAMIAHAFLDLGAEKVWCGYYDGNERSKRVQQKCGLRYQWTTQDVDVPQMNEKRVGHVNCITKEEWEADGNGVE